MGINTEYANIEHNRVDTDDDDNNDKNVDLSLQTRYKPIRNHGVEIYADNRQ